MKAAWQALDALYDRGTVASVALTLVAIAALVLVANRPYRLAQSRRGTGRDYVWRSMLPPEEVVRRLNMVREHAPYSALRASVEPPGRSRLDWYDNRLVNWSCRCHPLEDGTYYMMLYQGERLLSAPTLHGILRNDERGGCTLRVEELEGVRYAEQSMQLLARALQCSYERVPAAPQGRA